MEIFSMYFISAYMDFLWDEEMYVNHLGLKVVIYYVHMCMCLRLILDLRAQRHLAENCPRKPY